MYKNVVFDLDGTLVNSIYDIADSMNRVLIDFGFETHDYEKYNFFIGDGVDNLIKRAIGDNKCNDEKFRDIKKIFNSTYEKHKLDKTKPYDGIEKVLKALNDNKISISILSNKPDKFVKDIVIKLFCGVEFKALWGKKEGYNVKPDPMSLLDIIKETNCDINSTIYVGDSNVDVLTAKNANVEFCGVNWGFRGEKELIESGAKKTVNSSAELLEYILK